LLSQQVLKQDMGGLDEVGRAKKPHRLPVVLSQDEVQAVWAHLSGPPWIRATLRYGAGLRLLACWRLRVQEGDFTYQQRVVRDGKGRQDRVTLLPQHAQAPLPRPLHDVQPLHAQDGQAGAGPVSRPDALERQEPKASREWIGQEVLPAARPSRAPRTGLIRWPHVHKLVVPRAVPTAVRKANMPTSARGHPWRHACATPRLEAGYDMRTVQALLGHKDVRTTMRYTHGLNRGGRGVKSPADLL
jgi:site-specific recombinase XerD